MSQFPDHESISFLPEGLFGVKFNRDLTLKGWIVSELIWIILSCFILFSIADVVPREYDMFVGLPLFVVATTLGSLLPSIIFGWFERPWAGLVAILKIGALSFLVAMAVIVLFTLAGIGDGYL